MQIQLHFKPKYYALKTVVSLQMTTELEAESGLLSLSLNWGENPSSF